MERFVTNYFALFAIVAIPFVANQGFEPPKGDAPVMSLESVKNDPVYTGDSLVAEGDCGYLLAASFHASNGAYNGYFCGVIQPTRGVTPDAAQISGLNAAIQMISEWEACGVSLPDGSGGSGSGGSSTPSGELGGLLASGKLCVEGGKGDFSKTGGSALTEETASAANGADPVPSPEEGKVSTSAGGGGVNMGTHKIPMEKEGGNYSGPDGKQFDAADVAETAATLLHELKHWLTDGVAGNEPGAYTYTIEQLCRVVGCDSAVVDTSSYAEALCNHIVESNVELAELCEDMVACESCPNDGLPEADCIQKEGAPPVGPPLPPGEKEQKQNFRVVSIDDGQQKGRVIVNAASRVMNIFLRDVPSGDVTSIAFDPALEAGVPIDFVPWSVVQVRPGRFFVAGVCEGTGEGAIVEVTLDLPSQSLAGCELMYRGEGFSEPTSVIRADQTPLLLVLDCATGDICSYNMISSDVSVYLSGATNEN